MKINKTSPVKPPIVNLYKSRVCLEKAQVTAKKRRKEEKDAMRQTPHLFKRICCRWSHPHAVRESGAVDLLL